MRLTLGCPQEGDSVHPDNSPFQTITNQRLDIGAGWGSGAGPSSSLPATPRQRSPILVLKGQLSILSTKTLPVFRIVGPAVRKKLKETKKEIRKKKGVVLRYCYIASQLKVRNR